MNQCLKISIQLDESQNELLKKLQCNAQSLGLEGTIQLTYEPINLKIHVCGTQTHIEEFVDTIHHAVVDHTSHSILMEPFIRQKDYRGVFRIIE